MRIKEKQRDKKILEQLFGVFDIKCSLFFLSLVKVISNKKKLSE